MTIKKILAQNGIRAALEAIDRALPEDHPKFNDYILILSRYNSLEKHINKGVIEASTAGVMGNRIRDTILSGFSFLEIDSQPNPKIIMGFVFESQLIEIIKTNKRRRPEIAKEAKGLLAKYRAYTDEKQISPAFDRTGRRLKAISEQSKSFIEKLENAQMDDLSSIVEKVHILIADPVPNYNKLKEAYRLCIGRGMDDAFVNSTLAAKPDDDESKIQVAERIEDFLGRVNQI